MNTNFVIKYIHQKDLMPVRAHLRPIYFIKMNGIYKELSKSSEIQELVESDNGRIENGQLPIFYDIFRTALCIELLDEMVEYPSDDTFRNIHQRLEEDGITTNYEFESESIGDWTFNPGDDSLFSKFPKSLEEYLNKG